MVSTDFGRTWRKHRTNITDVAESTPSILFDAKTGLVSNYYYQRGRCVLKRRVAKLDEIFGSPLAWPEAEAVAFADEDRSYDAGNVNATTIGKSHYLAFYHGTRTQTAVVVATARALTH